MTHDSLAFPLGTNPDGISTIALYYFNKCLHCLSMLVMLSSLLSESYASSSFSSLLLKRISQTFGFFNNYLREIFAPIEVPD